MINRNGIDKREVAQTLYDMAEYIQGKNIGPAHNKFAEDVLKKDGLTDQIDGMDQAALDYLFGEGDPGNYWPGKLVPTLCDLKQALNFFAYREGLDNHQPVAQELIDRIKAFEGYSGESHLVITGYDDEIDRFISKQPRHAREQYDDKPSGADFSDEINVREKMILDWTRNDWMPDGDHIVCEMRYTYYAGGDNFDMQTYHREQHEAGLRHLGIDAQNGTAEFIPGKTYGEDKLVLRLTQSAYEEILVPEMVKHSGGHVCRYEGYEPNKLSFRGPPASETGHSLYIASSTVDKAQEGSELHDALRWLRSTGFVDEQRVTVSTASSPEKSFVRLTPRSLPYDKEPFVVGNRYWGECDLHNEMGRVMRGINSMLAGIDEPHVKYKGDMDDVSRWFEHEGKIYIPGNDAFEQVGFHFKHKQGLQMETYHPVSASYELKQKAGNGWWNVLYTDKLPKNVRADVIKELKEALDEVKADMKAGATSEEAGARFSEKRIPRTELPYEVAAAIRVLGTNNSKQNPRP